MAVGLAEAGADVIALDREACDVTVSRISEQGRHGDALLHDLAGMTPERAQSIVGACVSLLGGLDILVNNAGIIRRAQAIDYSQDDWNAVLDVNLNSVFYLCQAAARHFTAAGTGGRIVNIASMLSFQGGLYVPAYAAAKSGIAGLTRALANEWGSQGINTNAIAPGYMVTEVTAGIRNDPDRNQAILDRIPNGRWGEPDDLKGAVVFLASDAARYVNGIVLPVDGGWLAR
jgi:2-deoxy-D-gluconate 3-dehydrogenase